MGEKQETMAKVYFEENGFGSVKSTYEDARRIDKSITMDDVREFFKRTRSTH